jgi:hypothetical protein
MGSPSGNILFLTRSPVKVKVPEAQEYVQ